MYTMFSRHPFSCNYWVTYRCNSQCEFCKIWRDPNLKNIPDASFDNVKNNLDDLKKIGVSFLDFTGGEPLLNTDLPRILSYAKRQGFFVKLSTNALLYPELSQDIQGSVSRIYFSFDTISKDEYKIIRGIDGFQRLIESIEIAKKLQQNICLTLTLTDKTMKNIKPFVQFCREHKVTGYIHPCFSYFNNESLNPSFVKEIKRYFWEPYIRMSLPDLQFYYQGGNNIHRPSCLVGKSTFDISPDDHVLVPCFHHCTTKIKINGHLQSLFYSQEWKEYFMDNGTFDFCNHCSIDCYFGYSYWDRIRRGFVKENLSLFKDLIESKRKK